MSKNIRISAPWEPEDLSALIKFRALKMPLQEIRAKHFPDRSIDSLASALQRARKPKAPPTRRMNPEAKHKSKKRGKFSSICLHLKLFSNLFIVLDLVEKVIGHPDFDEDRPEEDDDDVVDLTGQEDRPRFDSALLNTPLTLFEANFSPSWWFFRPEISAVFVVILRIPQFSHLQVFVGQDRKNVKIEVNVFISDDGVEVVSSRTGIAYPIIKHMCRESTQPILLSFSSPVENPQILSKTTDPLHIIKINIPTQIAPIRLD
jgi:hypothetical protein